MNNKPGAGLVALASEGSMPDADRNMPLACNGGIAFLGVFHSHDMAVERSRQFVVTIQLCNNMGALSVGMLF